MFDETVVEIRGTDGRHTEDVYLLTRMDKKMLRDIVVFEIHPACRQRVHQDHLMVVQ